MIDSNRRTVLTAGAAAAAASAPQVFAQAPQAGAPAGAKVGYYEKGNVRIRYAEIGSGFPLLAMPGGGLNCIHEVKGFITTARMSRVPDERLYGSGTHDSGTEGIAAIRTDSAGGRGPSLGDSGQARQRDR